MQIPIHCAHDEVVAIGKLKPNPANPNKHPPEQIALLAKIIKAQGWRNPIVVSNRSGLMTKGHARLAAASRLGCKVVPVDRQDYGSEKEEWADMIADNRIAELAEADRTMLRELAEQLDDGAFDMDLTGFDQAALEELMTAAPPLSDIDAEPQIDKAEELRKKWGVERGQIWELGDHRLMCGDARQHSEARSVFNGSKCDICFTSPPYALGKSTVLRGNKNMTDSPYKSYSDDSADWPNLMAEFFAVAMSLVDCALINVQSLSGNKRALFEWVASNSDRLCDVVVWDKGHGAPAMARNVLNSRFEFLFIFGTGKQSRAVPFSSWRGTMENVYSGPPQRDNVISESHCATMPTHFATFAIGSICNKSKSVYEPFCGSGTTIIACEQLSRKCRAMEIDPGYVAVSIQRWADATGKTPKLLK